MRTKIWALILTAGVFAFMGLLNSAAFSGDYEEKVKNYESCIVREFERCSSKLVLLGDSNSKILQDYVRMEAQKAEFYKSEKDRLVKEMMEMRLEPKQYKVDLFLNSQFQEWYRNRK
jgi:hypothetical protein